jgi:hypothetical protein
VKNFHSERDVLRGGAPGKKAVVLEDDANLSFQA